jgi:chlorophyllide a reductase subunit X
MGKRVLLIGCDPKSDTTSLLFGGRACPTIIETSSRKKLAGEHGPRSATFASSATACSRWSWAVQRSVAVAAVAASSMASKLLEKLGFHDWGFDYVLLDFLGDVVCGGFGLPIARDMCQKVIVVGSNDLQSLYVANNVCSAVSNISSKPRRQRGRRGSRHQQRRRYWRSTGVRRRSRYPGAGVDSRQTKNIRRKSASYEIIGRPGSPWASLSNT